MRKRSNGVADTSTVEECLKYRVIEDNGEFYVPVEHFLIVQNLNGNVLFATYENSKDDFLYDILSGTEIQIGWGIKRTVEKILKKDLVRIRGDLTRIFTPSSIPSFCNKIVKLNDKMYIKLLDLEEIRKELYKK